jgi:KaiC/GvpD/RAD55 family RecA-like ATPase
LLESLLGNALEGFTIIQDDNGPVGSILAKQLGSYAEAGGRSVGYFKLDEAGPSGGHRSSPKHKTAEEEQRGRSKVGTELYGLNQAYVLLDSMDYDLVIIEGISTYLFDKTTREVVNTVQRLASLAKEKSFIIVFERAIVGDRVASYVKANADTVLIVRTEVAGDRVLRALQIQKMKGTIPSDKLIKFTLDANGLQVDTREFLG